MYMNVYICMIGFEVLSIYHSSNIISVHNNNFLNVIHYYKTCNEMLYHIVFNYVVA